MVGEVELLGRAKRAPALSNFSRALIGWGLRFLPKVLAAGTSFLFLFVVSRLVKQQAYGQAGLAMTIAAFCAPVTSLGQRFIVLRDAPALLQRRRIAAVRKLVAHGARATVAGCCLATTIVVGGILLLTHAQPGAKVWSAADLVALGGLILATGALEFTSQTLRALGRGDLSIYLREAAPRVLGLFAVVTIWAVKSAWLSGTAVLTTLTITALLSLLVGSAVAGRDLNQASASSGGDDPSRARSLRYVPNMLLAAARENMDVIIIGLLIGSRQVAIYFTLIKLSNLLTLPATALSTKALVQVTADYRLGHYDAALHRIKSVLLQSAMIAAPLATALAFASPYVLRGFGLDGRGYTLLIILVFLNGGIQGAMCGLWELMQCLPISRWFDAVFAGAICIGGLVMALAASQGMVWVAAGYLVMNLTWIGFGLLSLGVWARGAHLREPA